MPLHLLGKKSWNVYNQDNIDRVRRDEAKARAREEEEDERLRASDAERRLQKLRGQVAEKEDLERRDTQLAVENQVRDERPPRKRRRLAGEDDTDRDIRLAGEQQSALHQRNSEKAQNSAHRHHHCDAPLTDKQGHINLFPQAATSNNGNKKEKNAEAEAERALKARHYEDQYTLRFSNAAGAPTKEQNPLKAAPWYSNVSSAAMDTSIFNSATVAHGKDVWGNEDIGRRERDKMRIDASDPLGAMKKGIKQLQTVEQERNEWVSERQKEMRNMPPPPTTNGALKEVRMADERRKKRRHRSSRELEEVTRKKHPSRETTSLERERDRNKDRDRKKKKLERHSSHNSPHRHGHRHYHHSRRHHGDRNRDRDRHKHRECE